MTKYCAAILLSLALLLPFSASAAGVSVKYMYEKCQPLSQKGFKVESVDDLICHNTIRTLISASYSACMWFKNAKRNGDQTDMATVWLIASEATDTEAGIQAFLNWAKSSPEYWENILSDFTGTWLSKSWPCRIE